MEKKQNPFVSIVLPTKNEEENIENCLKSIKSQTYKNIEIIVVDNNSTDKTKEISKKYTKKVYNKGPERSAQQNFGMIEKSKGKYLMYIDADMILCQNLVEECVRFIQNEGKNFVALHVPEIVLGTKFFSKVRRFERTFYDGTVIDGARFFLREPFVKVNGFDAKLTGPEDWDNDKLLKQIGEIGLLNVKKSVVSSELKNFLIKRGIDPNKYGCCVYHNEAEFDLKKYLAKKSYYAGGVENYVKKWGEDDSDVQKQIGLIYRYFIIFTENEKWRKLVKRPILTFGMYFLRFLVGITFLIKK